MLSYERKLYSGPRAGAKTPGTADMMTRGYFGLFVSFLCFYFAFLPLSHVVLSYFHEFLLFLVFKFLLVILLVSRDLSTVFCKVWVFYFSVQEPGSYLNQGI